MAIGIIRKLDSLGRITLPKEYRKYLGIEHGDSLEMVLDKTGIKIKPTKKNNEKE